MSQGTLIWAKENATFNTSSWDKNPSVGADKNGNVYVAYTSDSGIISGGTSTGSVDVIVAKFDSSGNTVWVKQNNSFNTSAADTWPRIATDSTGNSYVCYQTSNGTVSGGTNSGGTIDIVLFKLDTNGNTVWVKQNSTFNTNSDETSPTISLDPTGNSLYLAYSSQGTISGGTRAVNGWGNNGGSDIVVCKFNTSDGVLQWAKQNLTFNTRFTDNYADGTSEDTSPSITVDKQGNVVVIYTTNGTLSGRTNAGGRDIVVFKMDSSGNTLWAKQDNTLNTSSNESDVPNSGTYPQITSITTDADGNIYILYKTSGTVSGSGGTGNLVFSKLNSSGTRQWINQTLSGYSAWINLNCNTICSDNSGNIIIIWFDYDTGMLNLKSFNTSGTMLWTKQTPFYQITNNQSDACLDSAGNICIVYQTGGTISGGTFSGGNDIVVSKFVGNGPRSLPGEPSASAPSAPSITSVSAGDKEATVSFTTPADNGSAITSYTVTSTPGSLTKTGSGTSLTVTGLSNGVSYTFTVTATNSIGTSSASSASSSVTPIAATSSIAVSETTLSISAFIGNQSTTTYTQKKNVIIDMRNSLKKGTFANNTEKANAKKAYIDAMRTKLNSSTQTIQIEDVSSFISTLTSSEAGLSDKPITLVYPTFNMENVGEVDIASMTTSSYLFFEAPIGYSILLKNGASSLLITFNGTAYTSGATTYAVGDYITVGDKSFKLIGVGSGGLDLNGGGGGGGGGNPICFLGNAPVLTPSGYRRIDSLVAGDRVCTASGRTVTIQQVKHQRIVTPSATVNPYVIPKGLYSATENVAISPRHCVAVPGRGMVEAREIGLRQLPMKAAFDYYNLELPEWENMIVAGVEVESLAPNKQVVITKEQLTSLLSKYSPSDQSKLLRLVTVKNNGQLTLQLSKKQRGSVITL